VSQNALKTALIFYRYDVTILLLSPFIIRRIAELSRKRLLTFAVEIIQEK
jgi:hypothetical protein